MVREFPATAAGYACLLDWLAGFGTVTLVGIEGTGSYGVGRQGKSDPLDAISAAPGRPVRPGLRQAQGP